MMMRIIVIMMMIMSMMTDEEKRTMKFQWSSVLVILMMRMVMTLIANLQILCIHKVEDIVLVKIYICLYFFKFYLKYFNSLISVFLFNWLCSQVDYPNQSLFFSKFLYNTFILFLPSSCYSFRSQRRTCSLCQGSLSLVVQA